MRCGAGASRGHSGLHVALDDPALAGLAVAADLLLTGRTFLGREARVGPRDERCAGAVRAA